jgi:hypothetical protein
MLLGSQQNISHMCKENLQGESQGSLRSSHSCRRMEHIEKGKRKPKIQKNCVESSQNAFQKISLSFAFANQMFKQLNICVINPVFPEKIKIFNVKIKYFFSYFFIIKIFYIDIIINILVYV